MKKTFLLVIFISFAWLSCKSEQPAAKAQPEAKQAPKKVQSVTADPAHKAEIEKWRAERATNLQKETGWLSLIALSWLKEGDNRIGSAPESDIVFPSSTQQKIGVLTLAKNKVIFKPDPGAKLTTGEKAVTTELEMKPDTTGEPTTLAIGTVSFFVIERAGKIGVRAKDTENPDRKNFAGLDWYPVDSSWKVEADFEEYNPPKKIPILNIIGLTEEMPSPGAVVFERDGQKIRIDGIQEGDSKELFLIFADGTSGMETYGAGRYLYSEPPANGKVRVDFNKAYNPPCAFTKFATCPLPPPQNKLKPRIEAGEKNYVASKHL